MDARYRFKERWRLATRVATGNDRSRVFVIALRLETCDLQVTCIMLIGCCVVCNFRDVISALPIVNGTCPRLWKRTLLIKFFFILSTKKNNKKTGGFIVLKLNLICDSELLARLRTSVLSARVQAERLVVTLWCEVVFVSENKACRACRVAVTPVVDTSFAFQLEGLVFCQLSSAQIPPCEIRL